MFTAIRPLLFRLDPERAHDLTLAALATGLGPRGAPDDPILATTLAGLALPNPVGLAAGFDKDARVPAAMLKLGFGFVEVGTLTPLPQAGNPRPRVFRLVAEKAVINRLGFNNGGVAAALARLRARRPDGIVGVNIGANKDSVDRVADYAHGARAAAPLADYLTVNISSPNTPGLRGLQDPGELAALIAVVLNAAGATPVFVKVAPDLDAAAIDGIARVAIDGGIAGLIVSNTTLARPGIASPEAGGLSGAPLFAPSTEILRAFARATGRRPAADRRRRDRVGGGRLCQDPRRGERGPALHRADLPWPGADRADQDRAGRPAPPRRVRKPRRRGRCRCLIAWAGSIWLPPGIRNNQ